LLPADAVAFFIMHNAAGGGLCPSARKGGICRPILPSPVLHLPSSEGTDRMKTSKPKGLGRGLEALLGADRSPTEQRSLAIDALRPGRYQPRTRMDAQSLEELAASIRAQGVMQPILVRPLGHERFEIIAGERRWRAAASAGLAEVPALVREIPDQAALAMSLIENIQRENLNPLEEAAGLQRLIDEFSLSHQEAADAVGRSRPAASNLLRLLELAKPVQDLLMQGRIDMGHARALLSLPKPRQVALAERIAARGCSVREAERMVARELSPLPTPEAAAPDRDIRRLEEELADRLGAAVAIRANRKGAGHVSIRFSSLDQLGGILERPR